MNFTREPIIESVITPREGFKLVVRNSKNSGQEEYFVDAVEVVSFGRTIFFRSLEKPKSFLVPVNDYEILEVREARMALKTSGSEKGIKIAGGREAALKPSKETTPIQQVEAVVIAEQRADKRKERRRTRKRRTKDEEEAELSQTTPLEGEKERKVEKPSLIPPPSTLISETLDRYKEYSAGAKKEASANEEEPETFLPPPPLVIQEQESEDSQEEFHLD